MSTIATGMTPKPKKGSKPTAYQILVRVDLDTPRAAWAEVAQGEGDPKAIIRDLIENDPELLERTFKAIPLSSWKNVLEPKPKVVF